MSDPPLILTGWRHSIYTAIVRLVLAEKRIDAEFREVDPFAGPTDPALSPFGQVPVLRQGHFILYETAAICRWLDEGFDGPRLQPQIARGRARMAQVIAIMDAHGFGPMVREVYGAGVFAAAEGGQPDPVRIAAGLRAARPVLAALEEIAAEGLVLASAEESPVTLADLHLAPMVLAFTRAPAGAALLAGYPALSAWWRRFSQRPTLAAALPPLPLPGS